MAAAGAAHHQARQKIKQKKRGNSHAFKMLPPYNLPFLILLCLPSLVAPTPPPRPPGPPSSHLLDRVRASARAGSPPHLYALGLYQFYGDGVPQDTAAALASFRAASDAGHGPAALSLALLLEARGEFGGALPHFMRAAEAGELEGAHRAAVLLFEGRAEAPSPLARMAEAERLLQRCAAGGYGPAFATLGLLREYGAAGGGADFGAAEAAYKLGCEGGGGAPPLQSVASAPDAEACYLWGLMLAFGRARTHDYGAAAGLFHRAIALRGSAGHAPAALMLGRMSASGQGVPVDYDGALAHFAAARDSGDERVSGEAGEAYAELDALVGEARAGMEETLKGMLEGMRPPPGEGREGH